MALITYTGPRGTRYGYRFTYQGREYTTKSLAPPKNSPSSPSSGNGASSRYEQAKAGKRRLGLDLTRLDWWTHFFEDQGAHYLQAVTPDLLDLGKAPLARAGKGPQTIRHYLALLRHLYTLAIPRWQLQDKNPCQQIDWPKVPRVPLRIPTAEERRQLLEAADPWLRPLILAALYTGMRQGALMRLRASQAQQVAGWLQCADEKGQHTYWVPLLPPLADLLRGADPHGILWHWPDGRPMRRLPTKAWHRARERAGLPWLRFHDVRPPVASLLAEAGITSPVVQAFLGHKSAGATALLLPTRPIPGSCGQGRPFSGH